MDSSLRGIDIMQWCIFITGKLTTVSRYALALSFIVFALLHFKYAEYISTLVPAWVPAKLFLAYL